MAVFRMTREQLDQSRWFRREEYAFESKFAELESGRMHYLDEGRGDALLLVHGTPSWSFEYRQVISALKGSRRCIAPDHLGFGLSDRPEGRGPTLPEHRRNLERFVDSLGLRSLDLVVHDFGGPIALPLLLTRPGLVRKVVILNSWFWPLEEVDAEFAKQKKWIDTPVMRFLYLRANFSAQMMVKMAWGKREPLDRSRHDQYRRMFPNAESRRSTWALAQAVADSKGYFAERQGVLAELGKHDVQVIWGMADKFINAGQLTRWRELLPRARFAEIEGAGHWPQEEAGEDVARAIQGFL